MISRRWWIFLFALMLLSIFGISLGADLQLLPLSRIRIPSYDKFGHFFLYGILAFLLHLALQIRAWNIARVRVPIAFFIVTALCVLDEVQQMFVSSRAADVSDFVADVLGILAFLALANLWGHKATAKSLDKDT